MIKRLFDFLLALVLLIVFSPLILGVAGVVYLYLGRPLLFRQSRPGLNGEVFELIKFRTMSMDTNVTGELASDEERLTRVGRVLREWSLDELPELVNILRGDMSFVGPRPLLIQYLTLYDDHQRRRHEVRPGLTGWAQVNGRNSLGWPERLALDVWYVDNRSFLLDLRILFRTIIKVFKREGISPDDQVTMEPFRGNPDR